ncbi:MAG TPA: CAP domain-containing protein [Pyrinomonadaceae bacterium]
MNEPGSGKFYAAWLLAAATLLFAPAALGRGADDDAERTLGALLRQADGQRHRTLTYNATLARVARARAQDMGERNYFDHVNPDGIGPNYLVTRAGYTLPDFYGKKMSSNNIESIASGSRTPEDAWENWMGSTSHRTHLLGLSDFYASQTEYGVGHAYVPGSRYRHYWVILIAQPGDGGRSAEDSDSEEDDEGDDGDASDAAEVVTRSNCDHPNVVHGPNGRLMPASGYVWVDADDPNDRRVRLMPGLVKTEGGSYRPARGYCWVNPRDPKDLRVAPIR